jgi:hypothetical protein
MATLPQQYPVGSLVHIRERDWIVLPSDDPEILCLRPLSGSESETCGIHRDIEGRHLRPAEFAPPKPEQAGDFGRLSVRPRPYQFVPLIMALKLDTVRMLIADDVGSRFRAFSSEEGRAEPCRLLCISRGRTADCIAARGNRSRFIYSPPFRPSPKVWSPRSVGIHQKATAYTGV